MLHYLQVVEVVLHYVVNVEPFLLYLVTINIYLYTFLLVPTVDEDGQSLLHIYLKMRLNGNKKKESYCFLIIC